MGWGRLVSLGEDLTSLCLRVEDEGGREHECVTPHLTRPRPALTRPTTPAAFLTTYPPPGLRVDVRLPCSYPDAPPEVRMDLPAAVVLRWGPGGSLQGVIAQCASAAAQYQGLWEARGARPSCHPHPRPSQALKPV